MKEGFQKGEYSTYYVTKRLKSKFQKILQDLTHKSPFEVSKFHNVDINFGYGFVKIENLPTQLSYQGEWKWQVKTISEINNISIRKLYHGKCDIDKNFIDITSKKYPKLTLNEALNWFFNNGMTSEIWKSVKPRMACMSNFTMKEFNDFLETDRNSFIDNISVLKDTKIVKGIEIDVIGVVRSIQNVMDSFSNDELIPVILGSNSICKIIEIG